MEDLLNALELENSAALQDKFYTQFSALIPCECPTIDEIIKKVWDLINKNFIAKDILFLFILSNDNTALLKQCLSFDESNVENSLKENLTNPYQLFDYTVYRKRHWAYLLFDDESILPESMLDAYLCLQIIKITNNAYCQDFDKQKLKYLIKQFNGHNIDNSWAYYVRKVDKLLKIVEYCKSKNSVVDEFACLNFASQNSVLQVFSEYLQLGDDYVDVKNWLDSVKNDDKDVSEQANCLEAFSILADFFKIIFFINDKGNINITVPTAIEQCRKRILNITDPLVQIDLLQLMFATLFMKKEDLKNHPCKSQDKMQYACTENQLRITLFILKSTIDQLKLAKVYKSHSEASLVLDRLHKIVADGNWRLELLINIVTKSNKWEANVMYYMLAEPEALIQLCLKNDDFIRAAQVLKVFDLESTPLSEAILYNAKLQELKDNLKRAGRIRNIQQESPEIGTPLVKLQFDNIAEEFLHRHPSPVCQEIEMIIQENVSRYPFLDHFKQEHNLFINILDLAITQTDSFEDSKALLHLALKYNTLSQKSSNFSVFIRNLLDLFNETAEQQSLSLSDILLNPEMRLDVALDKREEAFYASLGDLYEQFCKALNAEEPGQLRKDHQSHAIFQYIQNLCVDFLACSTCYSIKYLQRFYNYLKAFAAVLYIEKDSSGLVSKGKNASYFNLLHYNRSELMGKLLFQHNLDPTEFEKYFPKLHLDFMYHLVGNCFPTINLHASETVAKEELYPENVLYPPTQSIIHYIKKRNWLLALLLIEMYRIDNVDIDFGESRIQYFLNYLKLPKIVNLRALFNDNEIVTGLQHEFNYQKVHNFVYAEIGKHEFVWSPNTSSSSHSFEAAQEIREDQLHTTNWLKLLNVLDSIPETLFRKERNFVALRDTVLVHLVKDAFECEYYRYNLRINDRNLRVGLLLENIKTWPEEFCIDSIKTELSRFDNPREDDEVTTELKLWLKHIEHSKKVMVQLGVPSWTEMYEMSAFEPKMTFKSLIHSRQIDLLLEFIDVQEINTSMLLCIDEIFLDNLFDLEIDFVAIEKLLQRLPQSHAIKVCENLLTMLRTVKHLQFVVDYLMKHAPVVDDNLTRISLSLRMLAVFTQSEFDQQLLFLLRDPLSIVEVLIMNLKLDKLAAILDVVRASNLPHDDGENDITIGKIDELLRCYAEKSLDFRALVQPEPQLLAPPDHKLLQSLDTICLDLSKEFVMPEVVPSKDQWVSDIKVIICMCCSKVVFSMFNRKHHCRRCGRIICSSCSKKRMIVPNYGDILVRVCIDCFELTFKDFTISDDVSTSTKSVSDDYWMLTTDPKHNKIVREEFSYELAPNVSLCLSLMKLHSPAETYPRFLLDQCEMLLKLLIPNQEVLQEIDYLLVIRMLKSLALAAKMASQGVNIPSTLSSFADRILSQAELLGLLSERGCLTLLPVSSNVAYIDSIALMKLIDKLLEKEQWNLALEVSTKAGIEKSGVFMAWGISCLRAGNLVLAREKFSKCLAKNSSHDPKLVDSTKIAKNPPLLNEIVKILESIKESIHEDVVKNHQVFLSSTMTTSPSITLTNQVEGAIFIANKLRNLKSIENGFYVVNKRKQIGQKSNKLEDIIYKECVYYLSKYGTGASLVEFHLRYRNFEAALDSIINKQLSPEVFVDLYMKCLKDGCLTKLHSHISEMDPTLSIWKDYLIQLCAHLVRFNLLNSLYQLQLFMGDYIRAAMTCLRFYEDKVASFTDLATNTPHLITSLDHLNQTKEQTQWVSVAVKTVNTEQKIEETSIENPFIKKMTNEEIERHAATIELQIEVATFLANCERENPQETSPLHVFKHLTTKNDNMPRQKNGVPTLFGSINQKRILSVLCIVCANSLEEGFKLALRIINQYKLKPMDVYREVGKYFSHTGTFEKVSALVGCIQKSRTEDEGSMNAMCDQILIFAVSALNNAQQESQSSKAHFKELINLINDKGNKISACIEAKQLNYAYFLAVKYERVLDLQRIQEEAEKHNQGPLKILCQKALQKLSLSSSLSS